ncbi:ABC transporter ATP-binding protein [Nonomuraea sp. NPDC049269]|uniref:ABC transporter ATP-binding protein n=1 Tax=Nonomuraea sp. NPDC049269 TaxID=3364349 RepID=UPI003723CB45
MPEPVLEVRGLTKTFRVRRADAVGREEFVAVDDVSFALAAAGSLAVVGESGSGKSTTARMIVGLERPTSGELVVNGQVWPTARVSQRERRRRGGVVQMVFQDPYQSLDRRQRGRDAVDETLRLHAPTLDRAARKTRVDELFDMVGLDARQTDALPRALSGGQRQRVAIARALAANPHVLILDEAVAALDVSIQAQVLNLLADIRERTGVAYLFISHDLAVVRQLCDSVVVLHRGRVVERGEVGRVLSDPQDDYTRRLISSIPRPGWRPRRRMSSTSDSLAPETFPSASRS